MDAMAVSISGGIASPRVRLKNALLMAFMFGLFQAAMPLIGFYIIPLLGAIFGSGVITFVESADHWIAFALLAFIGGKMIYEAFHEDNDAGENPFALGTLFVMALATSIDALATGIVFRGFNLTSGQLAFAIISIGVVTFALSLLGVFMGRKLGERFKRYAVLGGGAVLIILGIKILLEHLL